MATLPVFLQLKHERPRIIRGTVQNVGVGVRHTRFPGYWHLALGLLSREEATSFPTLIFIANEVFGLLAGLSAWFPLRRIA